MEKTRSVLQCSLTILIQKYALNTFGARWIYLQDPCKPLFTITLQLHNLPGDWARQLFTPQKMQVF